MTKHPVASASVPMSRARGWLLVVLLLGAATALGLLLFPAISLTSLAMLYVLAVVIASYRLDWVQSAACAVAAVTALNFFFIPPRWTFEVESREQLISLAAMLVVALVVSRLASVMRREMQLARLNEGRARQLHGLATELANASTEDDVLAAGRRALAEAFPGPTLLVMRGVDGALAAAQSLPEPVREGLRACIAEAAVLGPGTGRWPGLNAWYLPLGERGHVIGAARIEHVDAADHEGRDHAHALCALLAQALWRLRLASSVREAQAEASRQQQQSTFLAAVSHDLRTPLAAIIGATSVLQSQRRALSEAEQDRLLASIAGEAAYLAAVTENTLQLVRLSSAGSSLRLDWESLEEIVGAVVTRMRARDPQRRLRVQVPAGLPLVRADPVLLAQLVGNLLDNAFKFSTGAVDLTVACDAQGFTLAVLDTGPGVAPAEQPRLFEAFAVGAERAQRGVGLGLAVSQAIARAHGGQLHYRPRPEGGSAFVLTLPAPAQQPTEALR